MGCAEEIDVRVEKSMESIGCKDSQLIPHYSQRCYQPNAQDEAHDFGDEGVEAGHDEQASEDRRANVACSEDCWWVSSRDDSCTAHVGVYADFHDRAPGKDGLAGCPETCLGQEEVELTMHM